MKLLIFLFSLGLLNLLIHCYAAVSDEEACKASKDFEELFYSGKDSYLANDWINCVSNLKFSLQDYHNYINNVSTCKIKCRKEVGQVESLYPVNLENLNFYENSIRETLCFMKCKRSHTEPGKKQWYADEILKIFDNKTPYDYLQLCYYQTAQYQEAASAAYTFTIFNPDNEVMKENLDYYIDKVGASREHLENLEAPKYVELFLNGSEHYRREEWNHVLTTMEAALTDYLSELQKCRFACEKPFDMGWFPDFITSVSNHFTYCLRCKRNCEDRLSNLNGQYVYDLLPLTFNYLQFSYFKVGKLKLAAEAVQTFLLLEPQDEEMRRNKEFYHTQMRINAAHFKPRKEIVEFHHIDQYEVKLMDFIDKHFTFDDDGHDDDQTLKDKDEEKPNQDSKFPGPKSPPKQEL